MNFPNDADGDALMRLYEDGVDLSKPHMVDFFIAVLDMVNGEKIRSIVEIEGFECSLKKDETDTWTCYCSKSLVLNYELLIEIQQRLDKLSQPYGGYCDGWGTFGD